MTPGGGSARDGREGTPANEHGFAFLSWDVALKNAFEGVARAYEARKRMVIAAHDAGLSYHTIARATGHSAANVHKIAGGRQATLSQEELLRSQAGSKLSVDRGGRAHDG